MSEQILKDRHSSFKRCVHTKNIYSLLDLPKSDDSYKSLMKHVDSCLICSDELKKFKQKTLASQVFIPKISMDRELKQAFESEVGELFKAMNLNEKELLKQHVKNNVQYLDQLGVVFLKNLVSKSMLKAYIFALILFLSLKFFL